MFSSNLLRYKMGFGLRWIIVAGMLSVFSYMGLSDMGVLANSSTDVVSQAVASNESIGSADILVQAVIETGPLYNVYTSHNMNIVCAIDQHQFEALQANFKVNVSERFFRTVPPATKVAEIERTTVLSVNELYDAIGINPDDPSCEIVEEPFKFLLQLLPGVS